MNSPGILIIRNRVIPNVRNHTISDEQTVTESDVSSDKQLSPWAKTKFALFKVIAPQFIESCNLFTHLL